MESFHHYSDKAGRKSRGQILGIYHRTRGMEGMEGLVTEEIALKHLKETSRKRLAVIQLQMLQNTVYNVRNR